jgi:hypothetical protein
MARIRTIKPEFWISEQIVECSPLARLLFVGMWTFADDSGVQPAGVKRLKMSIFPGDSWTEDEMVALVQELISVGLIREYVVDSKRYWLIDGWHHQKIDRPNFRYPIEDGSIPSRRTLDERSTSTPRANDPVRESSLRESSLRESKGVVTRARGLPSDFAITDDMLKWAEQKNIRIDAVNSETEKFRNHHEAKGSKFKSWPAAWRNWMTKAIDYNPGLVRASATSDFDEYRRERR